MISAGDFRNGLTLEIDGQVMQVLEFQHVKPGKGAAFVRTKMRNVIDGGVVEKTFRPTEKFPQARIDRIDMQYLYQDGDLYNFMNVETYDQIAINSEIAGDSMKFVKENEMCKVLSYNGSVFALEAPLFVELEVTETEPFYILKGEGTFIDNDHVAHIVHPGDVCTIEAGQGHSMENNSDEDLEMMALIYYVD